MEEALGGWGKFIGVERNMEKLNGCRVLIV